MLFIFVQDYFSVHTFVWSLREGPFCRGKRDENRSGARESPETPAAGETPDPAHKNRDRGKVDAE